MRFQGRLTEWNDARGFGFITPLARGPKLFVHISEFPRDARRPLLNDLVTYESSTDDSGRPRAVSVLHLTPVRPRTPEPAHRPESFRGSRRLASPQLIPILVVALIAALLLAIPAMMPEAERDEPAVVTSQPAPGDSTLQAAFSDRRSGIQVGGSGTVVRLLADDADGSRHQRFILRLASGQTLLVAHNVDLAPRVQGLADGATVAFFGVYEWNAEGGVIHWTHRDPSGHHTAGWLECNGRRYQ